MTYINILLLCGRGEKGGTAMIRENWSMSQQRKSWREREAVKDQISWCWIDRRRGMLGYLYQK